MEKKIRLTPAPCPLTPSQLSRREIVRAGAGLAAIIAAGKAPAALVRSMLGMKGAMTTVEEKLSLLYTYATNSNTWDGYTASADETFSGDGGGIRPYMAFKAGIPSAAYNDAWSSTSTKNRWIQIKLDAPKKAKVFGLCSRFAFFFNCPKTAHLLGGDGTTFDNLLDITVAEQPTTSEEMTWKIPSPGTYLVYRLFVDECFGDRISVGRFRLYG